MSLPAKSDLLKLSFSFRGAPCARMEPKTLNTQTLGFSFRGVPFVAAPAGAAYRPYLMLGIF